MNDAQRNVAGEIAYILDHASAEQWRDGMVWYESAHVWAEGISAEYNIPLHKACAIVAVLSPANSWQQNMLDTVSIVKAWRNGKRNAIVTTYGKQAQKAYAILDSTDASMLSLIGLPSARKTRAFYDNIYNYASSQAVTIDRHIMAALGYGKSPKVTAKQYESISIAFRLVAQQYGILPSQAQAIVWVCTRGSGE